MAEFVALRSKRHHDAPQGLPAGLHGDNLADGPLLAFILHELAVVAASEPEWSLPAG